MKIYQLFFYNFLISVVLFLLVVGCEYDVSSPQWEQEFESVPIPEITQVNPADAAVAGVNTITITGINFLDVPDTNGVYFDNIPAEIISNSATTITVRRPNLATDAATIKVVPNQTLVVAKHGPYRIDSVLETYGSFLDNNALYAATVDDNENLYVIEHASPHSIIKVSSDGQKETIGTTSYSPFKAVIGPDGRLYMTRNNNREILVFDENSDTEASRWTRLPRGMTVSHGVFDDDGYFYTGGDGSDLIIVPPDPPVADPTITESGYYDNDEILGLTIYQNYIYLVVLIASPDEQHPELAIWRHSMNGNGTVGDMELVLDLSANEIAASREINSIHFDANGNLFIGTDAEDPILINAAGSNDIDYFYKNILPSNCKQFYWGSNSHIYMIVGDNILGITWELYRVDMGALSGQ